MHTAKIYILVFGELHAITSIPKNPLNGIQPECIATKLNIHYEITK